MYSLYLLCFVIHGVAQYLEPSQEQLALNSIIGSNMSPVPVFDEALASSDQASNAAPMPPPLPEGWTAERYHSINWEDSSETKPILDGMTDEDDGLLSNYMVWSYRSQMTPGPPPPLPEGWTAERYQNTNWTDSTVMVPIFEGMSEKDGNLIFEYGIWLDEIENPRGQDAAESKPDPEEQRLATKYDFEDYWDGGGYGDFEELAAILDKYNYTCFGFVVFKTWGYHDLNEQQQWEAFWQKWLEYFDEQMRSNGAVGDVRTHGIASRLKWHLVDDPRLDGACIDTLMHRFGAIIDAEELEAGIDYDLALVPSKELAQALVDADTDSEPTELAVLGIDISGPMDFSVGVIKQEHRLLFATKDEHNTGASYYPGYFPLQLDALMPEAFLTVQDASPAEMWPGRGRVWTGDLGNDAAGREVHIFTIYEPLDGADDDVV